MAGLPAVFARIYLVCCLAERGEFSSGIAYGEEGIRIAEAADHLYSLSFACFGVGTLFLIKGERQRAIPVLERGLQLCRTLNLPIAFPLSLHRRSVLRMRSRRAWPKGSLFWRRL